MKIIIFLFLFANIVLAQPVVIGKFLSPDDTSASGYVDFNEKIKLTTDLIIARDPDCSGRLKAKGPLQPIEVFLELQKIYLKGDTAANSDAPDCNVKKYFQCVMNKPEVRDAVKNIASNSYYFKKNIEELKGKDRHHGNVEYARHMILKIVELSTPDGEK